MQNWSVKQLTLFNFVTLIWTLLDESEMCAKKSNYNGKFKVMNFQMHMVFESNHPYKSSRTNADSRLSHSCLQWGHSLSLE